MSLETVIEDIKSEAVEQAEQIREEAEDEADRIIEDAEAKADRIREEAEREVERQIDRKREQRLSSANLEAKQGRLEARRDALAEVRDQVEDAIADLPAEEREELTRILLEDAASEFEGADSVAVYTSSSDMDLLEDVLEEYDGYTLEGEYDCLGGVVVESEAGRLRVNNTFDSVLEDVWEDNLKTLSDTLFEEQ